VGRGFILLLYFYLFIFMDDINKLIPFLKNFEQEHRDLDEILIRLQEKNTVDFLQIQRLKKRKLILKDKILEIQNKLEPDSIA
jgi:Uncharacterized conserved small protein containing a coiled-coil domain